MRYAFIRENRKELPVKKMCQVLQVSRSGYYDWIERKPSERSHSIYNPRCVRVAGRKFVR